jgi:hypothetical protein
MGVLGLWLGAAACEATRQTARAKPSGFLGDYSQLEKGESGEAQLVYINPDTDFSKYNAVMIDSVTLWQNSQTSDVPAEQQQALTEHLYAALQRQLSQDYKIVSTPGPGVLRLRAAITEAKGANVAGSVVTGVVPQLRAVTMLGGLATNTTVFVGEAAIEVEITDAMTNERLVAAVDERAGTKSPSGMINEWSDVEKAFDYWAGRLRDRLREERR